tara:strand:+ start:110 stop:745 length:636 start_codon:yes stop_codon:yes gene_type:complete
MLKKIAILNYGTGNLQSIINVLNKLNLSYVITKSRNKIIGSDHVILPGVGNFSYVMKNLKERNLDEAIKERFRNKKPILGICLGMQIFFDGSEEAPEVRGLGLLNGIFKKIYNQDNYKRKIPHIGWHDINKYELFDTVKKKKLIFKHIKYYFLHSYYLTSFEEKHCKLYVNYYGLKIPSVIQFNSFIGLQFHPEISGEYGINFYKDYFGNY